MRGTQSALSIGHVSRRGNFSCNNATMTTKNIASCREGFPRSQFSGTDDLRRRSTFSVPSGWDGNYRSICLKCTTTLGCLTHYNLRSDSIFVSLGTEPLLRKHDPVILNKSDAKIRPDRRLDQLMKLQVFRPRGKQPFLLTRTISEFQTQNFG